jgi:hypothetical protein
MRRAVAAATWRPRLAFVSLFGRARRVARAARSLGATSVHFDAGTHPALDIGTGAVRRRLEGWVRASAVAAMWVAPPTATWSMRRAEQLRSHRRPLGLAGLAGPAAWQVAEANAVCHAWTSVVRMAADSRVPVVVELPTASRIWDAPAVAKLMRMDGVNVERLGARGAGCRWRQGWTLAAWNTPVPQASGRRPEPSAMVAAARLIKSAEDRATFTRGKLYGL